LEKRTSEKISNMELWNVDRQKIYGATEVLFLAAIRNQQS
jgi:hypothetical protein